MNRGVQFTWTEMPHAQPCEKWNLSILVRLFPAAIVSGTLSRLWDQIVTVVPPSGCPMYDPKIRALSSDSHFRTFSLLFGSQLPVRVSPLPSSRSRGKQTAASAGEPAAVLFRESAGGTMRRWKRNKWAQYQFDRYFPIRTRSLLGTALGSQISRVRH
jgi:hypothetical protein